MPILKEKGYSLTDNLDEVTGFILHTNSEPVGSIGLKKIDETTCEIVRVFIDEKYRGKGHARLLFEYAENYAKELGFKKAEMVAWCKAESALALYKKLGYSFSKEKESEWFTGLKYVELFKDL
jgi:ribosomal protein S18 acetylase RimI-like enzyme